MVDDRLGSCGPTDWGLTLALTQTLCLTLTLTLTVALCSSIMSIKTNPDPKCATNSNCVVQETGGSPEELAHAREQIWKCKMTEA